MSSNYFSPRLYKTLALALATSASLSLAAKPAKAITVQLGNTNPIGGSTTIDFEDAATFTPGSAVPSAPGIAVGDVTISTESGLVEVLPENSTANQSIVIGRGRSTQGAVRFSFNNIQRYFRFEWGNGRNGNTIEFFAGLDSVGLFNTDNIGLNDNSSTTFVDFFADSTTDVWDSVLLSDTNTSGTFRLDNVSYSNVPTPALLPGLLGMGAVALRKRRQGSENQAS